MNHLNNTFLASPKNDKIDVKLKSKIIIPKRNVSAVNILMMDTNAHMDNDTMLEGVDPVKKGLMQPKLDKSFEEVGIRDEPDKVVNIGADLAPSVREYLI